MDEIVDKVKNDIESFLMEDMENHEMEIDYILYNPKTQETQVLASDGNERIFLFALYTKEQENGYMNVPEWDFNFDEYFFKELKNGYEVGFVNDETNYGLWCTINDLYPEDIENIGGVQKYLEYCKDHLITRDYLDETMKMNVPGAKSTIDRMKYEIANEFGVNLGADATSRANGSVGGEITKRLVKNGLGKTKSSR